MSDERLRQFERRWRELGRSEDEADFLRERSRAGDLRPSDLELAAFCGHSAAKSALGKQSQARRVASLDDLVEWTIELANRFGREIWLRAAIIAAEASLPIWTEVHPDREEPILALRSIRDFLACPCEKHEGAAREACGRSIATLRTLSSMISMAAGAVFVTGIAWEWPPDERVLTANPEAVGDPVEMHKLIRNRLAEWALARR